MRCSPMSRRRRCRTYGWLAPGEMLVGLGLAETTPGPLILVLQFVGFLAAYRDPAGWPPLVAGTLGGLLTLWVTFAPCFACIFLGAPYVERLHANRALAGALAAVTAAVVGVIAQPRALVRAARPVPRASVPWRAGPLRLDLPVPGSLDPLAAASRRRRSSPPSACGSGRRRCSWGRRWRGSSPTSRGWPEAALRAAARGPRGPRMDDPRPLVTTDWLAAHLREVVVLDASWHLGAARLARDRPEAEFRARPHPRRPALRHRRGVGPGLGPAPHGAHARGLRPRHAAALGIGGTGRPSWSTTRTACSRPPAPGGPSG